MTGYESKKAMAREQMNNYRNPVSKYEAQMNNYGNRMSKCEEQMRGAEQEPDAYGYARRFAEYIWAAHYRVTAPQWKPLDDLMGVLTQIDNMTSGLVTPPAAQPAQEPVAWMWRCKPYYDYPNWEVSLKRPADSGRDGNKKTDGYEDVPLYTTPPQRTWVELTDAEFQLIYDMGRTPAGMMEMVSTMLKEKNNG